MWYCLWWCPVGQTSMSISACNHLLYNVATSVVAVFLISLMFSGKFLSQPIISAFCPSLTTEDEGRGVAT